jgi:hypothetical protein
MREKLPTEVPENSVLRYTIEVFAKVIGTELFRRERLAMDKTTRPEKVANKSCSVCKGTGVVFVPEEERDPGEPFAIPCPECMDGEWGS